MEHSVVEAAALQGDNLDTGDIDPDGYERMIQPEEEQALGKCNSDGRIETLGEILLLERGRLQSPFTTHHHHENLQLYYLEQAKGAVYSLYALVAYSMEAVAALKERNFVWGHF